MSDNRPFRFGVIAAQARSGPDWISLARRAEALGYSTFLIPDTMGATLSPFPALAFAASATETIRFGTYVLANDLRHPVVVAREAATLDFLSGGRLEFGIGAGRPSAVDDHRKLGIDFDPAGVRVERLAESLDIIDVLLAGRRATTSGRYYTVSDAEAYPRPVQGPRPPILVAAGGKRLLSLAARWADIIALAVPPDEDRAAVEERIGWVRQAAGSRFADLELNINLIAAGDQVNEHLLARLGLERERIERSGSLSVLMGTPEQMCKQLLERRDSVGISYITVADYHMDTLAPVVERLAGR